LRCWGRTEGPRLRAWLAAAFSPRRSGVSGGWETYRAGQDELDWQDIHLVDPVHPVHFFLEAQSKQSVL
jgi:hypothetical protein